jgi:hypothetical protein
MATPFDLNTQYKSPFDTLLPNTTIAPSPGGGDFAAILKAFLPLYQQQLQQQQEGPANLVNALQNLRGGGRRDSLTGAIMPADPLEAQRQHDTYFANQFRSTPERIARERQQFMTPENVPTFTEQEVARINARAPGQANPATAPQAPATAPAPVDITHPVLGVNQNMFPTRPEAKPQAVPTPTVGLANRQQSNVPAPSTSPPGGNATSPSNPNVARGVESGTPGGTPGGFPIAGTPLGVSPATSNIGYPGSPISYPPSVAVLPGIPQPEPMTLAGLFAPPINADVTQYSPGAGFPRQNMPATPPPAAQAAAPQPPAPTSMFMPRGQTTMSPGLMMPKANPDVIPEFAGQYEPGAAFPRQMRGPQAPAPGFWDAMRQMFALPPGMNPMLIR